MIMYGFLGILLNNSCWYLTYWGKGCCEKSTKLLNFSSWYYRLVLYQSWDSLTIFLRNHRLQKCSSFLNAVKLTLVCFWAQKIARLSLLFILLFIFKIDSKESLFFCFILKRTDTNCFLSWITVPYLWYAFQS